VKRSATQAESSSERATSSVGRPQGLCRSDGAGDFFLDAMLQRCRADGAGKIALAAGGFGTTFFAPMKMLSAKAKISGLTLIEVLVVICLIAILAAMLLPAKSGRGPAYTAICMNNQKQIAFAYSMWANDHGGEFPAQVPLADKGAKEFVFTGYASVQFRSLSDYLKSPNVFVCRLDKATQIATNTENLRDENVSYFINVDATTNNPSHTFLTGDRNLQANGQPIKAGWFEFARRSFGFHR
jgi:prepilin-type N-terminal cleavage/methylation domain-containing protein